MSIEQKIRQKLQDGLQPKLLEVVNESPQHQVPEGSESHFRVLIVSKDFEGLGKVQRHQKVYQILKDELENSIHAFSQKTLTPNEWEQVDTPLTSSPPCQKKPPS